MKKNPAVLFAAAVAMFVSPLFADDVYLLSANDASQTGAITNAAKWVFSGTAAGAAGAALPSSLTFGIGSKYTLCTLRTDTAFTGKALHVGTSSGSTGYVAQYATGDAKTSWDNWGVGDGLKLGLKLYRGWYRTAVANSTAHIYGPIELLNYGTAVFEINIYTTESFLHFHSPFTSAKSKKLRIVARADNGGVIFGGSMENFLGDIETYATSVNDTSAGTNPRTVGFGTTYLAGSLSLGANSTLTTASAFDVFSVGTLALDGVAGIDVKIDAPAEGTASAGRIVVSNAVTVANGPVVVKTSYDPTTNASANATFMPLVFAPGVSFNASDFAWTPSGEEQVAAMSASFAGQADNSTALVVKSSALVKQTVKDSYYVALANNIPRETSLTNATHWSDGALPHPGAAYLVSAGTDASFALRTPGDLHTYPAAGLDPIDYTFPGDSLSIGSKGWFIVCCSNVTVRNLRLFEGSTLAQAQFTAATLNGGISVEGNTIWRLYAGNMLKVKAEISGAGEIRLESANANSPNGQLRLDAPNTNFTGRIAVSQTSTIEPDMTRANQTVNFSDGRALGGEGAAFDPKAITLERCGGLNALADTAVSEATRGLWINGTGRVDVVSGATLTWSSPLAVYGTLAKGGVGTLDLANAQPAFGADGTGATPDADATNRTFLVRSGNVRVSNAYALNGLDIVVANADSTILLDAATTDETLASYGIVNIFTPGTPFAVSGEASKVKIGFTCAEKPSWVTRDIAICTVKAAQADAVQALLERTTQTSENAKIKIDSIVQVPVTLDDESCVTIKATVSAQRGMLIMVK